METGICGGLDRLADIKAAGADYAELSVQNFLVPLDNDDAFDDNRRAAEAVGLPIRTANGFIPGRLRVTGDQTHHDDICRYTDTACRRAKVVGIEHLVFGSGGARQLPDGFDPQRGFDQFVELLKRLGPIAGEHDRIIVVEALNTGECNFINTMAEGGELIRAVDHDHIRLLADLYHMMRNAEDPATLVNEAPLIHHVHIAENADRTPPGVAGDDFSAFFDALRASPAKRVSIEGRWPNSIGEDGPAAIAALREIVAG